MEIPATLYTKSGGTNLAYQIFGSGPPVISSSATTVRSWTGGSSN
jgi:hypothetical protein